MRQGAPESRRMVGAGASVVWKWASEFRVELRLSPANQEPRRSVGKAACSAVTHGQDID